MVVDKRGRYYAPMMFVVLYTMTLYLVIEVAVLRYKTAETEAIRSSLAFKEGRYESAAWSIIDETMHLGVFFQDCYISPFDDLFIELSSEYGTDWRLMSAIGYCESRFNPFVKSYSGAVGLMQIMPRTAKIYDVNPEDLTNPNVNIEVANLHFNHIGRMLGLPHDIDPRDRYALILASYNGGIGRVFDAMRLARAEGDDPHLWLTIKRYLALLRDPSYYQRVEVRSGRFYTARMTIRYVEDVLMYYDIYCEQTANCPVHLLPMGKNNHHH